jgi:hypothetical protein
MKIHLGYPMQNKVKPESLGGFGEPERLEVGHLKYLKKYISDAPPTLIDVPPAFSDAPNMISVAPTICKLEFSRDSIGIHPTLPKITYNMC